MHVWNVLHAARWKYRTQNVAKKSPSGHHRTTLSGCIFATKAHIDNRKKPDKQQYLFHMSSQYGELRPISGWDRFTSLGTPANFNERVSRVGFITAPTSLNWRQPNFARCLAPSSGLVQYRHFPGLLLLKEFCQVQNSLCVQVLRSPILSALLHGSRAVGVSQTLRRGTRHGIKEFL